jgi:hypothetical protein
VRLEQWRKGLDDDDGDDKKNDEQDEEELYSQSGRGGRNTQTLLLLLLEEGMHRLSSSSSSLCPFAKLGPHPTRVTILVDATLKQVPRRSPSTLQGRSGMGSGSTICTA